MEPEDYTVKIDDTNADDWTAMLPMFRDASIYQSWQHGICRVGRDRISHLQLIRDKTIIAAAQIKLWKPPLLGLGVADIFRGPLWKRKDTEESPEIFRSLVKELQAEYSIRRGYFLRIRSEECGKHKATLQTVLEQDGYRKSKPTRITQTLQIDLQKPIEQIRNELKGRWRRNLNKTVDCDFHITEGLDEKAFDEFVKVHDDMFQNRDDVSITDVQQIRNIIKQSNGRLNIIILTCSYQNAPISSVMIDGIGERYYVLLRANGIRSRDVPSSYFLTWYSIERSKNEAFRFFDEGYNTVNSGLAHHKRGLGGEIVSHLPMYHVCDSRIKKYMGLGAGFIRMIILELQYSIRKWFKTHFSKKS